MSLEELAREGHLRGPLHSLGDFCIEWGGTKTRGYGVHRNPETGKLEYVHRIIVDAPDDMEVDHLCQNNACIKFGHLEIVRPRIARQEGAP
jgi:hypothetical protein